MSDDTLKSLLQRAVAVEASAREVREDRKDIKAEAKSAGYDPKAFALLVRRQLEDADKREERERIEREADEMEAALGPLGAAAAASIRKAVSNLDALADKDGGTVTLEGGGHKVTFGTKRAAELRNVAGHEAPRQA